MNRRRIFAIALFMVLGFFIFTFANPRDDSKDMKNDDIVKPTPTATAPANDEEEEAEEQNNQEQNNNQQQNNNGQQNNNVQPVNNNEEENNNQEQNNNEEENQVEDLTAYREAAKKEIRDYRDSLNLETDTKDLIDSADNSIDEATTKEAIDKVVEDTKKALDDLKAKELSDAKEQAKKELKEYNEDELYSEENQEKVDKIKEDGYKEIDEATTIEEVKEILEEKEKEIDDILKLTDTYFKVTFVDFYGNETVKEVLYNNTPEAPVLGKVFDEAKGVVYAFSNWDRDFANVKEDITVNSVYTVDRIVARIYLGEKEIGNVDLAVTDALANIISANANVNIAEVEETVLSMITEGQELPVSTTLNMKYTFDVLKYVEDEGFIIEASEVTDEEALARNTVIIKYVINDNAIFADNTKEVEVKSTNGSNKVDFPTVYRNGNVVKVNWVDSNNEKVTNGTVYSRTEESKNLVIVLTGTLDKVAPEIKLDGEKEQSVLQTVEEKYYTEEGFTVTDNSNISKDDVTRVITKDGNEVSSIDYRVPGVYTITYTVEDAEGNKDVVTRTITVVEAEVESISFTQNKTSYFVGDEMETLTVTATYNNGKTVTTTTEYTVEGWNSNTSAAERTATVSFLGKTKDYTYEVKDIVVDSITVNPTSGSYFVGDSIETLTVTAYYNNGKVETITSGYEVTGFNSESAKKDIATVSYNGKTAEYKYEVKAIVVDRITVNPTSGSYFVGDSIETLTVTAYYNNGKVETITSGYEVTGFNSESAKKDIATVSFGGKTAEYKYEIKAIELEGITLSSYNGTYTYDTAMENVIVTAHYNNGKTEPLNKQVCTGSYWNRKCTDGYTTDYNFYQTWVGTHTIKYSYNGFTGYNGVEATYTYTIKPLELLSISLSETSGNYWIDDDMNNITVTAHYDNSNYDKELCNEESWRCYDGYTLTGFSTRTATTEGKAIFSYNGKDAEYNYTVEKAVPTLTLTNVKTNYLAGEYPQYTATLTYKGETYDVTNNRYLSDDISTGVSNVGLGKTATITYNDYNGIKATATFTYDVRPNATLYAGTEQVWYYNNRWDYGYKDVNVYYFEFELPRNASVVKIASNKEEIVVTRISDGKYYISEADYNKLQVMKQENSGRTLEITYKNKEEFTAIYTRLVTR